MQAPIAPYADSYLLHGGLRNCKQVYKASESWSPWESAMNWFNKLPGFVCSPPGMERIVLRLLMPAGVWGTLGLSLALLAVRLFHWQAPLSMTEIYLISLLPLYWSSLLGVAIAAFIVMVMKGPAYVADAYPLPDAELTSAWYRYRLHHQTRSDRSRGRRGRRR